MPPITPLLLAQAFATMIALAMLHMGITSFTNPMASTKAVGVPQRPPINPWVYMFAARETSLALALLIFAYLGDWRAVGVLFVATWPPCAATDLTVEARYGRGLKKAMLMHGLPASLVLPTIYALLTR